MKTRLILTPKSESDFSKAAGKLAYWKQILPEKRINYTTKSGKPATVDFTRSYLSKIIEHFQGAALDQTSFILADADNKHNMSPENVRGDVEEMRLALPGEQPGLYGKISFPTKQAAKAVLTNPKLGVSARIREDENGPTVIHVLGTLDPQVTGMEPWQPVDLSTHGKGKVLDLSHSEYTGGIDMAKATKSKSAKGAATFDGRTADSFTTEEIDAMDEATLDGFLTAFAPNFVAEPQSDELDGDGEGDDEDGDGDGDGNEPDAELSNGKGKGKRSKDIELANSAAAAATERANLALRKMADAEFKAYRTVELSNGVPAFVLDLAEPILNRPEDMVIDLSNEGGADDVNVAEIVRGLVEAQRGSVDIDLSNGHNGTTTNADGSDPDQAMLDAWEKQA